MPLRQKKQHGQPAWFFWAKPPVKTVADGYRFSLKGSPRHYDDVKAIIEADPGARIYFSEALTYERGAGVALWRVEASSFTWVHKLYEWWTEMERVEPIKFTFHLYLPNRARYAALDLRTLSPDDLVAFIKANAPRSAEQANKDARRI
jgi:hypothetical protein